MIKGNRRRRDLWITGGVLAIGVFVTVLASLYMKADVEATAQREFEFTCNEIRLNIETRLGACEPADSWLPRTL